MTTITIDNPVLEKKYSSDEIKMQFMIFLEKELKEDKIELYEVSVQNLSKKSQNKLNKIDSLNFIEY